MNSLKDYLISRDLLEHLQSFLKLTAQDAPKFQQKLNYAQGKQHISYEQWWRLLEELEEITCYDALGIEIGRHIKIEQVGVLGYLFRTARNVGEALNCFKRFQRLIYAGSQAHMEHDPSGTFSIVWNPDYGYSSQCSDELLLGAMITIVNEIIHPNHLNLRYVHFTQVLSEKRIKACVDFFNCPVLAKQDKLAIAFDLSDLQINIPHSDTTLHQILGKQAESLLISMPESDTFIADLSDIIIRGLHIGKSEAAYAASQMNISERTLHRKLKAKNKVYREILQEIRKSMALNYLHDPKLSLAEIALLLGYKEQSSFTRAFSNWYKCSPLQYQKHQL